MDWIHKSTSFMETSNMANLVQGNVPLEPQERHSSLTDVDMDLREVYFLILHFLSTGPCQRTFGHLRDEILEKGLLPRRYHSWWSRSGTCSGRADDDGISLPLSYDNLIERYPHIEKDHLVKLLKQLILNPSFPSHMRVEGNAPNAADVPTLLGSGTFSLVDRKNIESQKAKHVASYLRWPHMHADQVRGLSLREIGGGFRKHHRAPSILSACHAIAKPSTMVQKMQNIKKLRGHRNAVYCAIFDRSGRYVITGSDDRLVKIWSMETALCLASCRGHEGDITDLAVSSNNALVASASNDFVIRVWRLPDGMPISVLRGHTGAVTAIAFSPRQASVYQLLSSSDDGTCRIWDARYSQWLPRIYVPSPSDASTGKNTFTSSNTASTSNASQSHQILCCAYNANGTIFVTGSSDSNARVWSASKPNLDDAEQPTHELDVLRGHENDVNYVQFSGCAVAPKSSTADTLKEDSYPKFKNSWFCHDNIVTCSRDGSAIIWTPRSRKFHGKSGRWMKGYHLKVPPPPLPPQPPRGGPRQRFLPTPRGVNMIIWSLDNRFVLAAIMDCRICVWNAADGSLVHCLTGHSESSYVLDVHPFNPRIAMSAGYDGKTIIWDIWEGIPIKVYEIGRFKLVDGKFSQDGTSIVLSDDVGQIYFLNTGQGESQKNAKYDQFFLGDYRPLIRDTNGHVLDQETQLLPHRRNLQDLLCDSSMIPYPEPDQTMFQQRRLGQDYIMPPLADLDRLIEPLPEFIDAMYWEPEHEVLSDDNDSEYNAEVSSDGARASPCSNSSNELECSSEDSDVENIHKNSYHWKRRRKHLRAEVSTSSGRQKAQPFNGDEDLSRVEPLSGQSRHCDIDTSMEADEILPKKVRRLRLKLRHPNSPLKLEPDEVADDLADGGDGFASIAPSSVNPIMDSEPVIDSVRDSSAHDFEFGESTADVIRRKRSVRSETSTRNSALRIRLGSGSVDKIKKQGMPSTSVYDGASLEEWPSTSKAGSRSRSASTSKPSLHTGIRLNSVSRKISWLLLSEHEEGCRYIPQLGDEVIYFKQGHQEFLETRELNDRDRSRYLPRNLGAVEICKVEKLNYDTYPGSGESCCKMTLRVLDSSSSHASRKEFQLTLPDLINFPDFIVEKTRYDAAIQTNWEIGDECRVWWRNASGEGGAWWAGRIESSQVKSTDFPESPWERYRVDYETGAQVFTARGSLTIPSFPGKNLPSKKREEKLLSLFAGLVKSISRHQDSYGIQKLNEAAQKMDFCNRFPVPLYPELIHQRLENQYYRSTESFKHDVDAMLSNAELYFVRNAPMLSKIKRLRDKLTKR
ncbi:Bromodomain-like superfamily [Arabidopsis suecica]|uniref:Bromodomain-like superfamily n=1 Tax=Arabidopsis suecica TaxID=45249 RepID=A0A8T1XCK7_ARASU|nr:Bromodomain-like superfamily [Arabidopsis suecica]